MLQKLATAISHKALSLMLTTVISVFALPASAQVTHLIQGGELIGASNVNVGGTLYDVSFLDGPLTNLYDGASNPFTTSEAAQLATEALDTQVFVDLGIFTFDSAPTITAGCNDIVGRSVCGIYTLFNVGAPDSDVWLFLNDANNAIDDISLRDPYTSLDTTHFDLVTNARWSVAASATQPVPEPSTYAMLGLGLLGVMWASRRQKLG